MSEKRKIGEILLTAGVIDEFQLRSALAEQNHWSSRLGVTLIKLGFIAEQELVRALASQLDLPVATLEGKRIDPEVLALIPKDLADKRMCLPLFTKQEAVGVSTLFLAMDDPSDESVLDELRELTGAEIRPVLMAPSELAEGIDRFYALSEIAEEDQSALASPGPEVLKTEAPRAVAAKTQPPPSPSPPPPSYAKPSASAASARAAKQPASEAASASASPPQTTPTSEPLARALAELLIDRGVVSRDDLDARVRALESRDQDGDQP
ncbi:MAG: hypothetical protein V3T33_07210 [Myxococcota bacterium]